MVEVHISIIIAIVFIYAVDNSHNNKIFMKMTTTPYVFCPHFTSFALPSLLILHLLFHESHWLTIISECQTKKMSNNETFLAMQKYTVERNLV